MFNEIYTERIPNEQIRCDVATLWYVERWQPLGPFFYKQRITVIMVCTRGQA